MTGGRDARTELGRAAARVRAENRRGPEAHRRGVPGADPEDVRRPPGPGPAGAVEGACRRAAHLGDVQVRGGEGSSGGSPGHRAPETGTPPAEIGREQL